LPRNCLLKRATEGRIEVKKRRGRIREQLPDNLKENRRKGALDRPDWRTRCGRGYGPVARPTTQE
jgi:hypothetical protein